MEATLTKKVVAKVPKLRFPGFQAEWQTLELKKLASEADSSFTDGDWVESEHIIEAGIRLIQTGNIGVGQMLESKVKRYISDKSFKTLRCTELQDKDILICRLADPPGRACLFRPEAERSITSVDVTIFRPDESDRQFLVSLMSKDEWFKEINKRVGGSTRTRISRSALGAIPVALPTLPEQQQIAAFLGAVDRKIQQLKRKQELLVQYKKGVVQQLFSQELRFKRKDGGEFPEWEEKRLGDICSNVAYGMNASAVEFDGVNKYLRITDIDEDSREFLQTGLTSPGNELEDKYLLHEGDLLFARTGASVGKSYLYKKADGKVYFAGFLIRFRIEQGVPEFIYAQTRTKEYDRWVTENSMRSGQPGLNAEEYKSFVIQFPSLEEQSRIAGFLMALDAKVAGVARAVAAAQQWKKGLLQQMFV